MAKNQGKKAKKEADKAEKAKKEAEKAKKAKEEAEKAKQEELAREEAEKAKQEALNELYWDRGRNVAQLQGVGWTSRHVRVLEELVQAELGVVETSSPCTDDALFIMSLADIIKSHRWSGDRTQLRDIGFLRWKDTDFSDGTPASAWQKAGTRWKALIPQLLEAKVLQIDDFAERFLEDVLTILDCDFKAKKFEQKYPRVLKNVEKGLLWELDKDTNQSFVQNRHVMLEGPPEVEQDKKALVGKRGVDSGI